MHAKKWENLSLRFSFDCYLLSFRFPLLNSHSSSKGIGVCLFSKSHKKERMKKEMDRQKDEEEWLVR